MREPKRIVAANHRSEEVRLSSSSGGVFYALASDVLGQGGVVIGAAYKGTDVEHVVVRNEEELSLIRKSKYAPSSVASIKRLLPSFVGESPILFSGTPCQVKGLRCLLGHSADEKLRKLKDSIIWVEVACHGVPTLSAYQAYIRENQIRRIDFRCKRNGWRSPEIMIERMDGSVEYEPPSVNSFYQEYIKNRNLRKACLCCKSKYFTSGADLTMADFWGVEAFAKELDDGRGTSLVLMHTKKGISAWNRVSDDFIIKKVSLLQAVKWNPCILRPVMSPLSDMEKKGERKAVLLSRAYSIFTKLFR